MSHKSAYDAMIFTARPEEEFFLKVFFKSINGPRDEPLQDDPYYGIVKRVIWNDLRIGLVCIKKMGNVHAAIKAFEVLERTLPKVVFMVGLAGGYGAQKNILSNISKRIGFGKKENTFNYGDVGIGKEIFYHSNEKKEKGRSEIRSVPDIPENSEIIGWIEEAKSKILSSVSDQVNTWFNSEKYNEQSWLNEITDISDKEKYKGQNRPRENINIRCTAVSSGESLIKDSLFVNQIRENLRAKDISFFEMEAYGIGCVCKEFKIPFILAKGISDYADPNKDDKHRWKAIAASSAVVINLLELSDFKNKVLNKSKPERPNFQKHSDCLCPDEGPVICYNREKCDILGRNCINTGLNYDSENMKCAWISRVFDGLSPYQFSGKFCEGVLPEIGKGASITTFFPYSANDLISMVITEAKDEKISHSSFEEALNDFKKGNRNKMNIFVETVKRIFPHFYELNDVCQIKKITPIKYKDGYSHSHIARIIVFDKYVKTKEDVCNNPMNIVFPLLLGSLVPTYFTCVNRLEDNQVYITADITFISHLNIVTQWQNAKKSLASFSFFNKSQTLIISGHTPCFEMGTTVESTSMAMAIKKLHDIWEKWCDGSKEVPPDLFQEFPSLDDICDGQSKRSDSEIKTQEIGI
jgi:nucleoside phosphorylase